MGNLGACLRPALRVSSSCLSRSSAMHCMSVTVRQKERRTSGCLSHVPRNDAADAMLGWSREFRVLFCRSPLPLLISPPLPKDKSP